MVLHRHFLSSSPCRTLSMVTAVSMARTVGFSGEAEGFMKMLTHPQVCAHTLAFSLSQAQIHPTIYVNLGTFSDKF